MEKQVNKQKSDLLSHYFNVGFFKISANVLGLPRYIQGPDSLQSYLCWGTNPLCYSNGMLVSCQIINTNSRPRSSWDDVGKKGRGWWVCRMVWYFKLLRLNKAQEQCSQFTFGQRGFLLDWKINNLPCWQGRQSGRVTLQKTFWK